MRGDERGGQITLVDDPQAFVDAVVRIASDAALAEQLGNRKLRRVKNQFPVERMVGQDGALYDALLAAKNR